MERVRGDFILGLESITVSPEEVGANAAAAEVDTLSLKLEATSLGEKKGGKGGKEREATPYSVRVTKTLTEETRLLLNIHPSDTLYVLYCTTLYLTLYTITHTQWVCVDILYYTNMHITLYNMYI
jgi:hypothetical protein